MILDSQILFSFEKYYFSWSYIIKETHMNYYSKNLIPVPIYQKTVELKVIIRRQDRSYSSVGRSNHHFDLQIPSFT